MTNQLTKNFIIEYLNNCEDAEFMEIWDACDSLPPFQCRCNPNSVSVATLVPDSSYTYSTSVTSEVEANEVGEANVEVEAIEAFVNMNSSVGGAEVEAIEALMNMRSM